MDFLGRKMALEFFFYMIPRLQEAKGLENPAFIDINCIWLDIHDCSQNEAMQRKNAITGCLNRAPGASPDSNLPSNIQNQKKRSLLHTLDHLELRRPIPVSLRERCQA